jgi:tripartite-type tricarboxylate transporter receptor subunit TctC
MGDRGARQITVTPQENEAMNNTKRIASLFVRVTAAILIAWAIPAAAQQPFPNRPVTIIVPFAPGGPAEAIARTVAQSMQQVLGQNVIIELKPGAGGNVGAEYVAKQTRPDGYTLYFGSTSLASNMSLMKLNFDPRTDLVPVAGIGLTPSLIIVGPNSP